MDYLDKKIYIDKIVLQAKIGNIDKFNQLRDMYYFLLDEIYQSISEIYPFFKYRKNSLYHDFYFIFWEAIKTYNFSGDLSFSYHLKEIIIEELIKIIINQYSLLPENVCSPLEIKSRIKKTNEIHINRKRASIAIKRLSTRYKQLIFHSCYENKNYMDCAKIMKLSPFTILFYMKRAFEKVNFILKKEKMGKKRVTYRERVHKITHIRRELVK
jgi:DNA-directed RNA polymerase specialized sigma24 family protein